MFAATAAADAVQKYMHQQQISQQQDSLFSGCDVIVYEGTSKTMSKVRISGGGRVRHKLYNSHVCIFPLNRHDVWLILQLFLA